MGVALESTLMQFCWYHFKAECAQQIYILDNIIIIKTIIIIIIILYL